MPISYITHTLLRLFIWDLFLQVFIFIVYFYYQWQKKNIFFQVGCNNITVCCPLFYTIFYCFFLVVVTVIILTLLYYPMYWKQLCCQQLSVFWRVARYCISVLEISWDRRSLTASLWKVSIIVDLWIFCCPPLIYKGSWHTCLFCYLQHRNQVLLWK